MKKNHKQLPSDLNKSKSNQTNNHIAAKIAIENNESGRYHIEGQNV